MSALKRPVDVDALKKTLETFGSEVHTPASIVLEIIHRLQEAESVPGALIEAFTATAKARERHLKKSERVVEAALKIYRPKQGHRYTCWSPVGDPEDFNHSLPCGKCPGCEFQTALADLEKDSEKVPVYDGPNVDQDPTLCRCGHPKSNHELHDRFDERLWCNDCLPHNHPLHIFRAMPKRK